MQNMSIKLKISVYTSEKEKSLQPISSLPHWNCFFFLSFMLKLFWSNECVEFRMVPSSEIKGVLRFEIVHFLLCYVRLSDLNVCDFHWKARWWAMHISGWINLSVVVCIGASFYWTTSTLIIFAYLVVLLLQVRDLLFLYACRNYDRSFIIW